MQTVALVTHAQHPSTKLAEVVAKHGARFMPLACTEIKVIAADTKINDMLQSLARYDWIIFTSKNTVTVFFDLLATRHIVFPESLKIAAVGPATAASLQKRNIEVDFVPTEFSAVELARSFKEDVAGKRILFPRSARAVHTAVEELQRNGALVDVVLLYTVAFKPLSAEEYQIFKDREVSHVLFLSSSAVHALVFALGDDALALLSTITAICIGPQTASTAKEIPFLRIRTAQSATIEGVIDALTQEL